MSDDRFRFKPFAEMTRADYAAVGFKSGLEIHQQLLTAKKLFCRCPAGRYSDDLRRRDPPPHAADALRARRVRRHGADGVQDQEGDHLPDQPGDRLHLRDGRYAAVHDRRGGPRHRPRHGHALRPATWSTSSTSPASSTSTAASRPASSGRPSSASTARIPYRGPPRPHHPARPRGGRLPRGQRRRPPPRLSHRPPGHAPDRDRDRARHAHAPGGGRSGPDPAARSSAAPARCGPASGRPARTSTSASRGGTRIEIKGVPRIPRIPLLTYNEAMRQWNLLRLRDELRGPGRHRPRRSSPAPRT